MTLLFIFALVLILCCTDQPDEQPLDKKMSPGKKGHLQHKITQPKTVSHTPVATPGAPLSKSAK